MERFPFDIRPSGAFVPPEYEPWCDLTNAIVNRLVEDYRRALSGKRPQFVESSAPPIWYVRRFEEWIESADAELLLMGVKPEIILKKAKETR